MVATLLDAAGIDPTVINGGIINAYGTNARVGSGNWMVVEADESDGTFTKLRPNVAIVTNMDPEHLDFYGNKETMEKAFETFVESVPFYGFSVLCLDVYKRQMHIQISYSHLRPKNGAFLAH